MTTKPRTTTGMNPTRVEAIDELRRMVLDALGEHKAEVGLFGSSARRDVRQHSDIDIAILPRDDLPQGFFGDLAAEIEDNPIPSYVESADLRRAAPRLID